MQPYDSVRGWGVSAAAPWQGLEPTGRPMRIDEVYFFHIAGERIDQLWALEHTWTRMRQLQGNNDTQLGELGSLG